MEKIKKGGIELDIIFDKCVFENLEDPNKFVKDMYIAMIDVCGNYEIENSVITITGKFKGTYKPRIEPLEGE